MANQEQEKSLVKRPDNTPLEESGSDLVEKEESPEEVLMRKYLAVLKKRGFPLNSRTITTAPFYSWNYKQLPTGEPLAASASVVSYLQPEGIEVTSEDPMELLDVLEANRIQIPLTLFKQREMSGSGAVRTINYFIDLDRGLRSTEREGPHGETLVAFNRPGTPEDFEALHKLGDQLLLDQIKN